MCNNTKKVTTIPITFIIITVNFNRTQYLGKVFYNIIHKFNSIIIVFYSIISWVIV